MPERPEPECGVGAVRMHRTYNAEGPSHEDFEWPDRAQPELVRDFDFLNAFSAC